MTGTTTHWSAGEVEKWKWEACRFERNRWKSSSQTAYDATNVQLHHTRESEINDNNRQVSRMTESSQPVPHSPAYDFLQNHNGFELLIVAEQGR